MSSEIQETQPNTVVSGTPLKTLVGTSLIGAMGLASAVLLTNTRNYLKPTETNQTHPNMPILNEKAASVVMAAAPNLFGSLMRIPFAVLLEHHSSKTLHIVCMSIYLIGIMGLMIMSFVTQHLIELEVQFYIAYIIFGIISGTGLAVFSLGITTVSFWSSHQKMGTMTGIYGGVTNLAPGLFGLWVAKSIVSTSLGITYLIWIGLLLTIMVVSMPMIHDSPYHQLMFRKESEAKKSGVVLTEADYKSMKKVCQQQFDQVLFPTGNAKLTLVQSAKSTRTWLLVYLFNVSFGGFLAFTVYLPLYYKDAYGTSVSMSGYLGSIFTIVAAAVRIPGGLLSDFFKVINGGIFVGVISYMAIMIGSIIMAACTDYELNIFGSIVIACGIGCASAAVFKILPKFSGKAVSGTSGWVSGIGALGGVVWPLLMSIVERITGNIHMVFILFVGASFVAILCLIWINRRMTADERAAAAENANMEVREFNEKGPQ